MYFSQVQQVFIVEHYLASRSYLTCQNQIKDTFLIPPVSNKSGASRPVNRVCATGRVHDRNSFGRIPVLSDNILDDVG
jgi:hypothetical protein